MSFIVSRADFVGMRHGRSTSNLWKKEFEIGLQKLPQPISLLLNKIELHLASRHSFEIYILMGPKKKQHFTLDFIIGFILQESTIVGD